MAKKNKNSQEKKEKLPNMKCPKCDYLLEEPDLECPKCHYEFDIDEIERAIEGEISPESIPQKCTLCDTQGKNDDIIRTASWLKFDRSESGFMTIRQYYKMRGARARICQECIDKEIVKIKKDPKTFIRIFLIISLTFSMIFLIAVGSELGFKSGLITFFICFAIFTVPAMIFLIKEKIMNKKFPDIRDRAIHNCLKEAEEKKEMEDISKVDNADELLTE